MRILLVEDYESMGKLIQQVLTDEGHSVTWLVNGKDAIGMIENFDFDAVVSDWELEWNGPNGGDILEFAQTKNPLTTTIMFSSLDRTHELEEHGLIVDKMLTKDKIVELVKYLKHLEN